LYRKKFEIKATDKVATAGSCFAQHIARNMRARNFQVLDFEPPPPGLSEADRTRFGYGLYSARYANIYVVAQLLQLMREALGRIELGAENIWERDGRFFDASRPSVEPDGLPSADDVLVARRRHLYQVRRLLRSMNVFVFTMGLTEAWIHEPTGVVYPTAPGVIAGEYDPNIHSFKNFGFLEILRDLEAIRTLLKKINPDVRFLLTVSPVPLTATASNDHVLVATMYSKSVLRAVAGEMSNRHEDVDYFPSYEIVSSHPARGQFYEPNLRQVHPSGVEAVMRYFFDQHEPPVASAAAPLNAPSEEDVKCEEVLLEAFA
jgi:hypothetical protein